MDDVELLQQRGLWEQLTVEQRGDRIEHFSVRGDDIVRTVRRRDGTFVESSTPSKGAIVAEDLAAAFDYSWLRARVRPALDKVFGTIRVVDLFSGAGGMSLGVDEAARALGLQVEHALAVEFESRYLETYVRNFGPSRADCAPVEHIVDGRLGGVLTAAEKRLRRSLKTVDIAVGGPPCQGHSDLNNHTRRRDPKNALYDRMARFAEVVAPTHLVIENVPGVTRDRGRVFERVISTLIRLGYSVDFDKLCAEDFGVPQLRHRAVIVGTLSSNVAAGFLRGLAGLYGQRIRSVLWAIDDLRENVSTHPLDEVTKVSSVSQSRIDWMYDNDEYDLPDTMRPRCHKEKKHTYKSVYGRLFANRPAWTITTGFQVMGQGRFLHPSERRVITSHEAARLQFFPDFFDFGVGSRKVYAKMIGNAVPSKLAYVLALELLR
jgi:DNA (cytosine-5)-methyltransferase 1